MKTAMQDLREDLILTRTLAEESLLEIENQEVRKACQEVVRLTFNNIIKRINDELLELEKQQIGYSEEEVLNFTQTIIQQYKLGNTNIEQLDLLKETLQKFTKK